MKYWIIALLLWAGSAKAQTITYTPMNGGYQYMYLKADSGLKVPYIDTAIRRSGVRPGSIVCRPADSLFYGWNGRKWAVMGADVASLITLINQKVDSVTVSGDTLYYWKLGVSYGYVLPTAGWKLTGNTGCDGCIFGTTQPYPVRTYTNNVQREIIDTNGNHGIHNANPDAILDIVSTTSGVLIPRMTTTQRNAISSPPTSLLIYNTTNDEFNYYNGSSWVLIEPGTNVNIYNSDGTLSSTRTLTRGGYAFSITDGLNSPGFFSNGTWASTHFRKTGNEFYSAFVAKQDSAVIYAEGIPTLIIKDSAIKIPYIPDGVGDRAVRWDRSTQTLKLADTSSTPTLQQVFNTETGGAVLTKNDTIDAASHSLTISGASSLLLKSVSRSYIESYFSGAAYSNIDLQPGSFDMQQSNGSYSINNVVSVSDTSVWKPLVVDSSGSGYIRRLNKWPSGGGSLFPLTGTGTATGNVTGDLASNTLSIMNGNVGIGTSAPTAKLHINGSVNINKDSIAITTGKKWKVYIDTVTNSLVRDSTTTDLSVYLPLVGAAYTTTTGDGLALTTSTLTTGNLMKLTNTSTVNNGAGLLSIVSSGANSTASKTTYGQQISVTNTGTTSTNVGLSVTASGATNNYAALFTGNVGIGTTTPSGRLEVKSSGSGTDVLRLKNSGDILNFEFYDDGGYGEMYVRDNSANTQTLISARASVPSYFLGKLGVGNSSPSTTLDVTGTANVSSNATIGGTLGVTGTTTLNGAIAAADGANKSVGVSAAMTAGTITISNTRVTANSRIFLTHASLGGTQGILSVGTIVAGTSFVINSSSATDTGTVNWLIIN